MNKSLDGVGNGLTATEAAAAAAIVVVAVKSARGRGSGRAFKWAVEKLMGKENRFVLVHVVPTVTVLPTPSGQFIPIEQLDSKVVEMYVADMKGKSEEIFIPFRRQLKEEKMETLVLQGDDPASVLVNYITDMRIATLVLGSCSFETTCFGRKPKSFSVPSTVLNSAPHTCNVYVVTKHGLITNNPYYMSKKDNSIRGTSLGKRECNSQATTATTLYTYKSSFFERKHKSFGSSEDSINVKDRVPETSTCTEQVIASHISPHQKSDIQEEVDRLQQELQSTRDMYNQACEDLVYTQRQVEYLSLECREEERRVTDAQKREEILLRFAAKEKKKHLKVTKEVEMARNQCAKEVRERKIAELNALRQSAEKQKVVDALFSGDKRYRRYSRDEIEVATDFFSEAKVIGEGACGKVYKCYLDNTPVAIKVLRSDAPDKKQEFLREIEVLSQLHHPHILLLLGACPESGCLIYEYMENGSLEDHILRGNRGSPLPWFVRFRIAYEVASGLAFLHHSGPEPIVHRDLKPGNILLDRNFVSKIGDVGLAKIIPEIVPDNVTEYGNSVLAGTLCYMDPEYQRTGTIRPKSDLYALGVIILQLLAACHPNKAIMRVEKALRNGSFPDVLDDCVTDWPLPETMELAQIALKCCRLRCRDRPELLTEVLPVLKKLAEFADARMRSERDNIQPPSHYYCPILQEIMDDPQIAADGFSYEHIAIKKWIERHDVSPVTKLRLQNKTLTPNIVLRSAIKDWRSRITP